MLTKNNTPFLFGTKACSRRPPQREMTLIAKGVFALAPGPARPLMGTSRGHLKGEVFRDDDDERRGECLYPGDFADYKLNAELLLKGACHTPQGKPMVECPVRFNVGAWSKTLRVVGPRVWTKGAFGDRVSDPLPFTRMPLSFANAFGGPDYPVNPAGMGFKTDRLPTIEHPAEPIRSRSDRPSPASFGPINPAWPPRAGKLGKAYGKAYREKRAPYYAEDFDWTYFHAAPADQQWKGYLRGDEEITLNNLHPKHPVLSMRLPGLRVRAFVKDDTGAFREVVMSLDTLFVDADEGRLILTWRGVDQVRESDLADVSTVLVVSEPLDAPPLPVEQHRATLEAFERDPIGLERDKAPSPESDEGQDALSALLAKELGGMSAEDRGRLAPMLKDAAARMPPGVDFGAKVAEIMAAANDTPPVPYSSKPGGAPSLGLRKTVRKTMSQLAEAEARLPAPLSPETRAKLEELSRLPHDPRWSELDPDYTPPEPLSTDEPGPGANLVDRDFTDRDLSGADLRGANLEGAVLVRTRLAGANLSGARLKGALLFKADLTKADLTKADLTRANAAKVQASGANFTSCRIEEAFFEEAVLTETIFHEAHGQYTVFAKADLTRAKLSRASLHHADFANAGLQDADFSSAALYACVLADCQAAKASFEEAQLTSASFERANVEEARFGGAKGERVSFIQARLDGADFGWASLKLSHFTEASARGARFFGANLAGCRFYRASLEDAEIVKANLFDADLCKAKLSRARFTGSCLYEAKLLEASGAGCDFLDANLKRSTLEDA